MDGLDEILIASRAEVPAASSFELTCLDKDLTEYIKKDKIDIRVKTVTDEIITEDYTINTHSEFFIDAKILGI